MLRTLKNVSAHCYLPESAAKQEKWGRYTFPGFDPKPEVTCINGELKAGNLKLKTDDPSAVLRQILEDYKSPHLDYLPLLQAVRSAIFPTTTRVAANPPCGWRSRTRRTLRMWT